MNENNPRTRANIVSTLSELHPTLTSLVNSMNLIQKDRFLFFVSIFLNIIGSFNTCSTFRAIVSMGLSAPSKDLMSSKLFQLNFPDFMNNGVVH